MSSPEDARQWLHITHVATYIGYVGTVLRILGLENWDITAHNYDMALRSIEIDVEATG
jgi:hypothetical protein